MERLFTDHPNGLTSVYAHLDHFPKKIEQLLEKNNTRKSQRKRFYANATIRVEKEVIAILEIRVDLLGASSFEIRETKTELPLNPNFMGLMSRITPHLIEKP